MPFSLGKEAREALLMQWCAALRCQNINGRLIMLSHILSVDYVIVGVNAVRAQRSATLQEF